MNGQTTIYALADPNSGEVRYIGKTSQTLKGRLNSHVWDASHCRNHRSNWIRSLGVEPTIRALMLVPHEMGSVAEIYAIALYRSMGYRLTNLTAGGEGMLGVKFSMESRARMSAARKGKKYTARQAASVAQRKLAKTHCVKGHEYTPENLILDKGGWRHCRVCRNQAERDSQRRRFGPLLSPEEMRASRVAAAQNRGPKSAETCARLSVALKGNKNSAGVVFTAERRAKISAALKGKQIGRVLPPKTRAKISAALKAKTHCRKGHEYSPENTYVSGNGWRYCRLCSREQDRSPRRRERVRERRRQLKGVA